MTVRLVLYFCSFGGFCPIFSGCWVLYSYIFGPLKCLTPCGFLLDFFWLINLNEHFAASVIIFVNWLVAFWTFVLLKSKSVLSKGCNKDNIIGTKGSSEFCCRRFLPDILLWKLNVVFLLKTVIIIWEVCTSFDPADNLRVIWKYVWLLYGKTLNRSEQVMANYRWQG